MEKDANKFQGKRTERVKSIFDSDDSDEDNNADKRFSPHSKNDDDEDDELRKKIDEVCFNLSNEEDKLSSEQKSTNLSQELSIEKHNENQEQRLIPQETNISTGELVLPRDTLIFEGKNTKETFDNLDDDEDEPKNDASESEGSVINFESSFKESEVIPSSYTKDNDTDSDTNETFTEKISPQSEVSLLPKNETNQVISFENIDFKKNDDSCTLKSISKVDDDEEEDIIENTEKQVENVILNIDKEKPNEGIEKCLYTEEEKFKENERAFDSEDEHPKNEETDFSFKIQEDDTDMETEDEATRHDDADLNLGEKNLKEDKITQGDKIIFQVNTITSLSPESETENISKEEDINKVRGDHIELKRDSENEPKRNEEKDKTIENKQDFDIETLPQNFEEDKEENKFIDNEDVDIVDKEKAQFNNSNLDHIATKDDNELLDTFNKTESHVQEAKGEDNNADKIWLKIPVKFSQSDISSTNQVDIHTFQKDKLSLTVADNIPLDENSEDEKMEIDDEVESEVKNDNLVDGEKTDTNLEKNEDKIKSDKESDLANLSDVWNTVNIFQGPKLVPVEEDIKMHSPETKDDSQLQDSDSDSGTDVNDKAKSNFHSIETSIASKIVQEEELESSHDLCPTAQVTTKENNSSPWEAMKNGSLFEDVQMLHGQLPEYQTLEMLKRKKVRVEDVFTDSEGEGGNKHLAKFKGASPDILSEGQLCKIFYLFD